MKQASVKVRRKFDETSVTLLWGVKTVKETCAGSDGPDTVNQSTKIYNKEAETYFSQPMIQKRVLSLSAGMYLY
jgi:hypothetical protein